MPDFLALCQHYFAFPVALSGQSGVRRRLADSSDGLQWGIWGGGSLTACLAVGSWLQEEFQALQISVSHSPTDKAVPAEVKRDNSQPGISGLFDWEHVSSYPLSHLTPPAHDHFCKERVRGKTNPKSSKQRGRFIYFGCFLVGKGAHVLGSYSEGACVPCS